MFSTKTNIRVMALTIKYYLFS